jgi:transposase
VDRLPKSKINIIRRRYINSRKVNGARLAAELNINRNTVYKYLYEFAEIRRLHPNKLKDMAFMLPRRKQIFPKSTRYDELISALPGLVENYAGSSLDSVNLWKDYKVLYPDGYCHYRFWLYYTQWRKENNICHYYHRRIKNIPSGDEDEFESWRNGNDRELWRKAVAILDSYYKRPMPEISKQIEINEETILKYIERYQALGIKGLLHKTFTPNAEVQRGVQERRQNVLKLIQQTPKLYDINRTSWSINDLSKVYEKLYNRPLSSRSIRDHLQKLGYKFQKSRERLTSPDKHFQEKMDRIKSILSHLQPSEKFFSIDEYGPGTVRMKTGWSQTKEGEIKSVPQIQKSKGWYIMTAALELSTNQVTHFYSVKKDTEEMIKLINILLLQYKNNTKLYLSWDDASWHRSKKLSKHLELINSKFYREVNQTPLVELAPLPSSAQYLNIIESVFSGMAKAIIHNSDYESLAECQAAVDRYYKERNEHFLANPKRAGNKIWGKEVIEAVFDDTKNAKSRKRTK